MSSEGQSLTRGLEILLSVACGICVASLYYIQPLEAVVAGEFGIPAGAAGIAVTCVQLGYAAGLLLVVPLGDLVDEARAWETGVDELAAEDEEVAEYVKQLEEVRDATDLPEASGEAIAREFERYLRRRGADDR